MDNLEVNLGLLAVEFRAKNGLNSTESIHITSLLQKNNIVTIFLPLSTDFSGMAVLIPDKNESKRFILINSNHTIGRQHFTICHELYHLYYQKNFVSEKSHAGAFNKKGDIEEYKADIFASNLLLPTNGVLQMIPEAERNKNKITLKTILTIEHYYSCSRSALLNKLLTLKYIDKELLAQHSVDKTKNAMLYGYNTDLYKPGNEGMVIGNYGTIAHELFDKGIVSESSYFSLLEDIGVDLSELDNQTDNE